MNKSIILVFVCILFFIVACSHQTVVKYQCVDGSFVDSRNLCSAVESQLNCSKVDCALEEVLVEKIKVICLDGSTRDKITDCPDIQSLSPVPLDYSQDRCSEEQNKNLVEVYVGELDVNTQIVGTDNVKWYPSLDEGYVLAANLKAKNTGCTKSVFKFDAYLLKDNSIISEISNIYGSYYPEGIYPGDDITAGFILFSTSFGGEGSLEFNETGEYVLRVVLNLIEDKKKTPLAMREDLFIVQ